MEKKIISTIPEENEIIPIKGDGNCAYRAILQSLNEPEDYIILRNMTSQKIKKDRLTEDYYLERNFNSFEKYVKKIELTSFYADEPELIAISKIKKIWIAIYIKIEIHGKL